jgi:hypothetical protein
MPADVCTTCGQTVKTVITIHGRIRDLDPDPHPDGNIEILTRPDGVIRAHIRTGPELPIQSGEGFRAHSCAKQCRVCKTLMVHPLAKEQNWATHPACDLIADQPAPPAPKPRRRKR